MMGIRSEFRAFVKQVAPHATFTHCMIHRYALAVKTFPLVSSMSSRRLLKLLITSEAVLRTPDLSKCCERKLGLNSVYSCSIRSFAGYHGESLSTRVRTERRNCLVSWKGENS